MKLRCGARTDVGQVREQNEDSYGFGPDDQAAQLGTLIVVCDGMGGHAAGEVASRLAVDTVLSSYYADPREQRPEALEAAFVEANRAVYAHGRGTMGTTGVAALFHHDALRVANVGDSRAYLIRNNDIRQISHDHSLVADQVAAGLLTPEQARVSMIKNVITRALGHQGFVTVDMFREPVQVTDIVLLCSDGLHGLVSDEELVAVARAHPPDAAAQQLVALANERGGSDNITVALIYVDGLDWGAEFDEDQDELHERITEPLDRATRPLALEETAPPIAAELARLAATSASPAPPAEAAPPARSERPLKLLGVLLSLILFSVLLLAILSARSDASTSPSPTMAAPLSTVVAPTAALTPTSATSATAAPTSGATSTP